MKRTMPLFALAAALFAGAAFAQDNTAPAAAPAAGQTQTQGQTRTKEQRKQAWENGVKQDCSAEIADGGVCAGKDFSSGLMDCLHKNRKKLSDGCKAAIHHRHHGMKKKGAAGGMTGGGQGGSNAAPAAPAAPSNPPQQ